MTTADIIERLSYDAQRFAGSRVGATCRDAARLIEALTARCAELEARTTPPGRVDANEALKWLRRHRREVFEMEDEETAEIDHTIAVVQRLIEHVWPVGLPTEGAGE